MKDICQFHPDPNEIEIEDRTKEEPSGVKKFNSEPNKKFLHELHACKKPINQLELTGFNSIKGLMTFLS